MTLPLESVIILPNLCVFMAIIICACKGASAITAPTPRESTADEAELVPPRPSSFIREGPPPCGPHWIDFGAGDINAQNISEMVLNLKNVVVSRTEPKSTSELWLKEIRQSKRSASASGAPTDIREPDGAYIGAEPDAVGIMSIL